ncbi:putative positive effector protein GCN20 [Tilletiaria anomala UBC 951]|uniref:Putative positive effector protein GCN20 n=1 Tax=Tilletiaria anomala (strain ATCC 24038 / CBS 436.72 / UBC 951) TaxID=1037660 RepID=A0A066VLH2_TILAU|nr:putative positive effector protein GCN20 [Tilletiaria anomala UBC 951]KDN39619.1 putative positive effector protein GCN20 [Tilletiaria anomala UBC 951]
MATAKLLRKELPKLDEPIVSYLSGYVEDVALDADPNTDPMEDVIKPMLVSATLTDRAAQKKLAVLFEQISKSVAEKMPSSSGGGDADGSGPAGLTRLERVVDMRTNLGASKTAGFDSAGGVDISLGGTNQTRSTVDVKKLEKQEAKTRQKLAKRAQRDLYESSKLVETAKKQESYEEMFLKVNPLESVGARGKNKDINLPSIDLSFGSLRILSNATLTLTGGRRYGLIGRNGVGKSTLLRNMALREVPIPTSVSLLYVEQEIVGDDTTAIEAVLRADVWRAKLMEEEKSINDELQKLEESAKAAIDAAQAAANAAGGLSTGSAVDLPTRQRENKREELSARLGGVQARLVDMEAETGPARAAALLYGLGFNESDQQKPTKAFSGGWRMRLALARALFCKPDLLMLDEPSNHLDLPAVAWLEDYLANEWTGTLLLVSHDRAFLNQVATDIIHMHSERLDYYKGNFDQFYETREERRKNQQREYEANMQKRAHIQAFVDRWRVNANRAAQAQSKLKELERMPVIEPPEQDDIVKFRLPETERLAPPLLQLDGVTFGYTPDKLLLKNVSFDVTMDSRIAVVGGNGAGKTTLMKLLLGEINPTKGMQKRNSKLRVGWFTQHHVDQLDLTQSAVGFLAARFPGKTEQEYRQHLGAFGITGMTGLQKIATLSGGQKSRVAFAALSLLQPHILILDEPTNHLDIEGLDALMDAIKRWNGGIICVTHDERFISGALDELWVCHDGTVEKFYGSVSSYKQLIVSMNKQRARPM